MNKTIKELQETDLNSLDVYVNGKHVAMLSKEYPNYVLTYLPSAGRDDFVSLSMPVRAASWVSEGKIHPFFEVNLPEGTRRQLIAETFGKAMVSEDMSLLALVGTDTLGRVSITPRGFGIGWRDTLTVDIDTIDDSDKFFHETLSRYAAQGISGVQPKLITNMDRVTIKSNDWIIKHDGEDLPFLSVNEHLSMSAAKAAKLNVAETRLSLNGKSLYVKRFDSPAHGFEDFCSLLGLSSSEKYSGSMERMTKVAQLIVSNRTQMKETIVKSSIFNICIGNADAHLKNFGVLYTTNKNVSLSPLYDLVSVRAFDDFKNDIPSLSIGGKKDWVIGKVFYAFASNLGISKTEVDHMIDEVTQGVLETIPSIVSMSNLYPEFREHAKRMIGAWSTGIKRINGQKINQDDFDVLPQFGMSGPKFEAKKKEVNLHKKNL